MGSIQFQLEAARAICLWNIFPLNHSSGCVGRCPSRFAFLAKRRRSFHVVPRPRDEINQVGCHTAQEADYEQYPTKPQPLPCPPLRGFLYEAKAAAIRINFIWRGNLAEWSVSPEAIVRPEERDAPKDV